MLTALATFQARTKELNPLKAKQKQRFVMGLKQVGPIVVVLSLIA
jgi:hypothetical protein